ncbi:translation elongation factor Ts [Clostridium sp. SM-530-WT-3G]|uniref:translation elongation factor Ts n=1 Tax=Clostridium sp. SM-530-WT-3G TaxID=2725303 RepID=UPI00145FB3C8|nr:translation elongation factor Ts [Clostridium sp. SM-530-WT-3G]NME81768.1 elongation factor Ts [Clostridium sp. SM-530-WT-3G]
MANISAQLVKELREMTGAKMMDCKKALVATEGNIDKAIEFLREKGLADAAKKSGRVAAEGIVKTYISEDKKAGAVLEFNCETDFVAANDEFIAFADRLAQMVVEKNPANVEALSNEMFDENTTVADALKALIAKLGENMTIRRFTRFSIENGIVKSYIHGGGRIGVLVELGCDTNSDVLDEVAKEVCMQIAAANPLFLSEDQVDAASIEKEKEIYRVQALNEGKPENIVEKMVEGRIKKYYKEVCLLDQLWVKDNDKTIAKFLAEKSKEVGSPISITRFVRYERGEGIEVEKVDFAAEVAAQMGK